MIVCTCRVRTLTNTPLILSRYKKIPFPIVPEITSKSILNLKCNGNDIDIDINNYIVQYQRDEYFIPNPNHSRSNSERNDVQLKFLCLFEYSICHKMSHIKLYWKGNKKKSIDTQLNLFNYSSTFYFRYLLWVM